jgi:formylmethanofuran dehydrogenase subunit E
LYLNGNNRPINEEQMEIRDLDNPREEIEKAVNDGDLEKLLRLSGLLHGHYCPGLAMGVKAAAKAVKELKVKSTGMEEVVATVEINNCFADGVQMVTGCSFGNAKCSLCGEDIMEPRISMMGGKVVCPPCSGQEYYQLGGDGICLKS